MAAKVAALAEVASRTTGSAPRWRGWAGSDEAHKLLLEALASDRDRLRASSATRGCSPRSINPGSPTWHGLEEGTLEGGSKAHVLVMELVEGEDLAERLKRGAIPFLRRFKW